MLTILIATLVIAIGIGAVGISVFYLGLLVHYLVSEDDE